MVQPCGPLKEILMQISEGASCPECRQKGVFAEAVELKRLGRAVALRCSHRADDITSFKR